MKKLLLILSFTLPVFLLAQRLDKQTESLMTAPSLAFEQHQYNIGTASVNAMTVKVNASTDEYTKDWKEYLKSNLAIEGKKNSGFLSSQRILIPQWSTDSMTVHYKTERDGDYTRLIVAAEQKGTYVTEENNPELVAKIKASVTTQIKSFYVKYYDQHIAEQQKYYDGQVSDMEKLRKKQEKVNSKLESNNKSKQKTENNIRDANSEANKKDGDIKSLNSQLQNNKSAVVQAQKEVDAQTTLITAKEGEYNRLNYSGSLNSKEGEKVIKELGKLRKKQEKLQGTLTKASSNLTKTENAILKAEQGKSKQEAKVNDLQSDSDSFDSKNSNLKSDLQNLQKDMKDKQESIDAARANLDKLKLAKDGISAL